MNIHGYIKNKVAYCWWYGNKCDNDLSLKDNLHVYGLGIAKYYGMVLPLIL